MFSLISQLKNEIIQTTNKCNEKAQNDIAMAAKGIQNEIIFLKGDIIGVMGIQKKVIENLQSNITQETNRIQREMEHIKDIIITGKETQNNMICEIKKIESALTLLRQDSANDSKNICNDIACIKANLGSKWLNMQYIIQKIDKIIIKQKIECVDKMNPFKSDYAAQTLPDSIEDNKSTIDAMILALKNKTIKLMDSKNILSQPQQANDNMYQIIHQIQSDSKI